MKREIVTELKNEIIAIKTTESKNENVLKSRLKTPTVDIKMALIASNATTRSAVVGPLMRRNNTMTKEMAKIISAPDNKYSVMVDIISSPPQSVLHIF